jgi:uracil-DNA glycosylase
MGSELGQVIDAAKACDVCAPHLKDGVRPVFQVSQTAKILIAGQAPGRKVHETGIPFDDASGDRLRDWMGIDRSTFYDPDMIAILPMGFCYPGTGKSGDLPPRPECAPKWRRSFLELMPQIELTLVIGKYAMDWHLKGHRFKNLTETVRHWQDYAPSVLPLPHPSPRNNIWLKKNEWFAVEVLPHLKARVSELL